jgi:hypothetical protein
MLTMPLSSRPPVGGGACSPWPVKLPYVGESTAVAFDHGLVDAIGRLAGDSDDAVTVMIIEVPSEALLAD